MTTSVSSSSASTSPVLNPPLSSTKSVLEETLKSLLDLVKLPSSTTILSPTVIETPDDSQAKVQKASDTVLGKRKMTLEERGVKRVELIQNSIDQLPRIRWHLERQLELAKQLNKTSAPEVRLVFNTERWAKECGKAKHQAIMQKNSQEILNLDMQEFSEPVSLSQTDQTE